jgi:tetratricopeptide (TPR) repeat protein
MDALVEATAALFDRYSVDHRLGEVAPLLDRVEDLLAGGCSPWAEAYQLRTRARLAHHLGDYRQVAILNKRMLALPWVQRSPRLGGEAWVALGEINRLRGSLDQASKCYAFADELLADSGSAAAWLPRLNRVLVLMARGEHQAAATEADRIWHTAHRLGLLGVLTPAAALVLRFRSGDPEGEAVALPLRELTEAVRAGNAAETDYIDLLLTAGQMAQDAGFETRARRLWRLAAIVMRQLGRRDDARKLEARLVPRG